MSDGWKELLRGFDEVAPSFDVWEVVQHRRSSPDDARPSAVGRYYKPALRWSIGVVGVCGLLLALALAAHSRNDGANPTPGKGANDHRIVPDVRIGAARIGETRTDIESVIGTADTIDSHAGSMATYRAAGLTVTYGHVVRFKGKPVHGKLAVVIRTTSPAYATAEGIHVGSTLGDLKRAYDVTCAQVNRGGGNECSAGGTRFDVYEGITATRPYKVSAIQIAALISSDGTLLTSETKSFNAQAILDQLDPARTILGTQIGHDPPYKGEVLRVNYKPPKTVVTDWAAVLLGESNASTHPNLRWLAMLLPGERLNVGQRLKAGKPQPQLSTQTMRTRIVQGLAGMGATVRGIRFVTYPHLGPAPLVVATITGSPKRFIAQHPSPGADLRLGGEGWLIAVYTEGGERIELDGAVTRNEISMDWWNKKYACLPSYILRQRPDGCPT